MTRRDIVCISINEWGDVPRNQVQLMREAVRRGYRVLYVETVGLRRPELTSRDAAKILRRLRSARRPLRQVDEGLWVLSPLAVPFHGVAAIDSVNRVILGAQVRLAMRRLAMKHPILWSYLPQGVLLKGALRAATAIYYRCDEYTEYRNVDVSSLRRLERSAVGVADLCLASARGYLTGVLRAARVAEFIPNAVDVSHYAEAADLPSPYDDGSERLVAFFFGTLDHWLSQELVLGIAAERPEWRVVLAGPVRVGIERLEAAPNVEYLGVIPYSQLPRYVAHADVGIVPFRVDKFIEGASPGKVFQYLAAGTPVVVTPFLDMTDVLGVVKVATEDTAAFVAAIESAAREDSPDARERRRAVAARHTWAARFDVIEALLENS